MKICFRDSENALLATVAASTDERVTAIQGRAIVCRSLEAARSLQSELERFGNVRRLGIKIWTLLEPEPE